LAADYDEVMSGPTLYMQQRYYDPLAGRFLSVDPVTTDAKTGSSFNRYVYGNNNPYKFKDPDGRFAETLWDIASLALSVNEFRNNPSIGNAIGVAVDAAAVVIPGIPGGVGAIRSATSTANKAADAVKGTAGGERAGKAMTPAGKAEVKAENAAQNGGQTTCNNCGQSTVPAKQSQSGVTPPGNETHVDHVVPKSKGGDGSPSNGQVLCRDCNLKKSDN
jgi:RHS repeat-associated protein